VRAEQVKAAIDRRPDVKSAAERTDALMLAAKRRCTGSFRLSAQGQIRFLPDRSPPTRGDGDPHAHLTWSIFDNGSRYADRRTKVSQAESQALDEKLLRRSVANDVELAIIACTPRATRIASPAMPSRLRRSSPKRRHPLSTGARARHRSDERISKQFDAEVSRATAKLQMEQAYLDLRFALGLAPIEEI